MTTGVFKRLSAPGPRLGVGKLTIAIALSIVGCGKSPVKTVPVHGRITFHGGQWPADGMVVFAPKQPAEGYPARSGQAMFGPDGEFAAGTFATDDGLIPGVYMVNLRCFESTGGELAKGVNHVPPNYQRGETSGWEVTVPPDDSEPVVVNLNVPAP